MQLDEIYRTYAPMVLRRCRKLLRDEACAEEAMQETFVRYFSKYSGDEDSRSSLLFRIATHHCLNEIRRRRHVATPVASELALALEPGEEMEPRHVALDFVLRTLGRDPVDHAQIAVLRFVEELSHEEIAHEVGMSVSGVRRRLRQLEERFEKIRSRHV